MPSDAAQGREQASLDVDDLNNRGKIPSNVCEREAAMAKETSIGDEIALPSGENCPLVRFAVPRPRGEYIRT